MADPDSPAGRVASIATARADRATSARLALLRRDATAELLTELLTWQRQRRALGAGIGSIGDLAVSATIQAQQADALSNALDAFMLACGEVPESA